MNQNADVSGGKVSSFVQTACDSLSDEDACG
jgi:hypothetical protein